MEEAEKRRDQYMRDLGAGLTPEEFAALQEYEGRDTDSDDDLPPARELGSRLSVPCDTIPNEAFHAEHPACDRDDIRVYMVRTLQWGAKVGDCQFDAVAMGLCSPHVDFRKVREAVANALLRRVRYDDVTLMDVIRPDYPHLSGIRDAPTFRRRLAEDIRKPGNTFWGDELTLMLAADVYSVQFILLRPQPSCSVIRHIKPQNRASNIVIVLFWTPGHYDFGVVVAGGVTYPNLWLGDPVQRDIYRKLQSW